MKLRIIFLMLAFGYAPVSWGMENRKEEVITHTPKILFNEHLNNCFQNIYKSDDNNFFLVRLEELPNKVVFYAKKILVIKNENFNRKYKLYLQNKQRTNVFKEVTFPYSKMEQDPKYYYNFSLFNAVLVICLGDKVDKNNLTFSAPKIVIHDSSFSKIIRDNNKNAYDLSMHFFNHYGLEVEPVRISFKDDYTIEGLKEEYINTGMKKFTEITEAQIKETEKENQTYIEQTLQALTNFIIEQKEPISNDGIKNSLQRLASIGKLIASLPKELMEQYKDPLNKYFSLLTKKISAKPSLDQDSSMYKDYINQIIQYFGKEFDVSGLLNTMIAKSVFGLDFIKNVSFDWVQYGYEFVNSKFNRVKLEPAKEKKSEEIFYNSFTNTGNTIKPSLASNNTEKLFYVDVTQLATKPWNIKAPDITVFSSDKKEVVDGHVNLLKKRKNLQEVSVEQYKKDNSSHTIDLTGINRARLIVLVQEAYPNTVAKHTFSANSMTLFGIPLQNKLIGQVIREQFSSLNPNHVGLIKFEPLLPLDSFFDKEDADFKNYPRKNVTFFDDKKTNEPINKITVDFSQSFRQEKPEPTDDRKKSKNPAALSLTTTQNTSDSDNTGLTNTTALPSTDQQEDDGKDWETVSGIFNFNQTTKVNPEEMVPEKQEPQKEEGPPLDLSSSKDQSTDSQEEKRPVYPQSSSSEDESIDLYPLLSDLDDEKQIDINALRFTKQLPTNEEQKGAAQQNLQDKSTNKGQPASQVTTVNPKESEEPNNNPWFEWFSKWILDPLETFGWFLASPLRWMGFLVD